MVAGLKRVAVRRLLAGAGVLLAVVAIHGCMVDGFARHLQRIEQAQPMPARIDVAYVREMVLADPPKWVSRPKRVAPPRQLEPADLARAASMPAPDEAPQPPEPEPEPGAIAEARAPEPLSPALAVAPAPASSPTSPAFEWPVSTRMRYVLTGNYRGEVHGQAQVEWVHVGTRYQVHLDVTVGPSFAPFVSRRMSSDGEITADGLAPTRYDQETKLAFSEPYRAWVRFDSERVWLDNGHVVPRGPSVQDTASQFVQLTWMFASQREPLRVGQVVTIPLAMPRNVSDWVYDVAEEETLYTPFGQLQAFHLKPRREARAGGDLTTDIWIAPQLAYLPVRFVIHQDADTYVDLMLDHRPELAAPAQPKPAQ